ncbi:DNA repair and recombination protein RadB [Methanobrevibacter sp. OttesenSCG-928-K11]|nr:DNA repair and recombination protein RadB [Methanobrevibacter sp. OttesenSCG-928-K11]MDL2270557.1 DNA repair and recombination protein RadB [Methanobrevibacter sp. OttesenSCG-928-I08]
MKLLANFDEDGKIPTNSSIDNILGGGIEKGSITQFFGAPGSGKTNVAISLAVNVAKNGRKVLYIDTEGGLSIDRIKQIAGESFQKVANNIIVFEPTTFSRQIEDLKAIESWLVRNHEDLDLIILDSAVALYRVDDGKSSRLNKDLGKQMGLLASFARKYNIAILLTNQIYSSFDEDGNGNIKAVGGTILQYWSKAIVQFDKGEELGQRIATLQRHKSIGEGKEATFKITSKGIE